MSRTFKHRPYKHTEYAKDQEARYQHVIVDLGDYLVTYWSHDYSNIRKKPRRQDTEYHWQSTPSWWTRMFMRKPQRVRTNRLVNQIKRCPLPELDLVDVPNLKRKPHVYFW